jgi:hypothetical protein
MAAGAMIGVNKWSNYSGGFGGGVIIQEIPSLGNFPGTVLWVSSTTGSDSNHGTFKKPYATLAHALSIGNTANRPNIGIPTATAIICMPGHIEVCASAGALTFASATNAGVDVYFCGGGLNRAAICFQTATTATMLIKAPNVRLFSPLFINGSLSSGAISATSGIDALASPIGVQAAGFQMFNAEYYDTPAKATLIQVLTTSAANSMGIYGYKYYVSTTGTQKTAGIQIVGGNDIVLRNIDMTGDFTNGPLYNLTTACLRLMVDGCTFNNLNATPLLAVKCLTTTTGVVRYTDLIVASGATFVTGSNVLVWNACYGAIPGATGALKP